LAVIVNRILLSLEMLVLFPIVFLVAFAYSVGLLGNGSLSSTSWLSQIAALLSLLPLSYVAVGYVQGTAAEFAHRFKAMWAAGATVLATLVAVTVNALSGDATRLDVAASLVVVPFAHLLIAGCCAPPNKSLERTRGE
jgi:hypothetical protein